MKKILSKFFYPILIVILVGFLSWKNYTPGTILSGWDTLHPEFNVSLYLKRAFFGAWQEHQGIGAPAAQSHAAELTRIPFVALMSFVLPTDLVRYSFFFLTLLAGSLGTYFLTKHYLSGHKGHHIKDAAFLSAIFYVLNLATLQQYFNPLEMFAVHFATLPWLILLASRFLRDGGRKNLIWFSLVTLLSSSMAHTATLFYVYFVVFSLFVLVGVALSRKIGAFKRGVLLILLTLGLNLFWLGPNVYYVINQSGTVSNSKIHRTFSDEAFLQSRAYGNLESLGILKNFPFNWREYGFSSNSFENLMRVWDDHLTKPLVKEIGYGSVALAVLGIVIAIFRRSRRVFALLPLIILPVFFWFYGVPKDFPLFREALRFPFTKFSIILISALSVFLGYSSQLIMEILGKAKVSFIFVIFGLGVLVYFMQPAFEGNFIDNSMKVKIPNEYFEAFDWFAAHDHSGRVAKLPLQTFWDWNFHSWGYQGAGFTWFGIPQPTLDREFDRWGLYNEDFYFQASRALYGNDPQGFFNTLKKYQVKYLLLDESIMNAGGSAELLYIPQIKDMVSKSDEVKKVASFGFLTIYETNYDIGNNFISAPKTLFLNYPPEFFKGNLLISEDLSINKGFPEAYNCDIKKEGVVSKQNSKEGIHYRADMGGVSCDYINYPELKYDQGYILRIVGENREGRSLKFYLTNYLTERADLEELLPNGKFDESFYIYPSKLGGEGYSVNFETRSYGGVASENLLTKVEIYDAIVQEKPNGEYPIENNLRIKNVNKYGTWAYKLDIQSFGLIQLGQGFESGWIAIHDQNSYFTLLPHTKINSWANGWVVQSGSQSVANVYILYWPQLLEWGGVILGIVLTYLIFRLY
jgi:hypothetical protein